MNLKELARAAANATPDNHSVLIYGPPRAGKTRLVGTAARIKEINKIYWFDLEKGFQTLLHMGLTEDELEKIVLFRIPSTSADPIAIETMLKAFSSKVPVKICYNHGVVACPECAKTGAPYNLFSIGSCTHNDLVVIDTGSALADSALSATMKGQDTLYKAGWEEYGMQGKWLGDILSVIQQCYHTNYVLITHELPIVDAVTKKISGIIPLMGSASFSSKCAKYFGTVVYAHKKMNKHFAASSSTYRGDIMSGSRLNIRMEDAAEPNMAEIFIKGGILRQLTEGMKQQEPLSPAVNAVAATVVKASGGLAAKLAAKQTQ